MGEDGAACFHTLTTESRDLDLAAWNALRFGQVCTKASNFADTKKVVEQLCYQTNTCTYAVQEQIKQFFQKVEAFDHRP